MKSIPTTDLRSLLVAEPAAPGLTSIPNVIDEVSSAARQLRCTSPTVLGAVSAGATVGAVVERLPGTSLLHLACHGQQDEDDPLQSGFCLRDGRLTIAELMRLELPQPLLAVLSACETAKGSEEQPDQAVHLAAAMLFVGFRSVVATMWYAGST
jgi:CHAT domain-containing protein